MAAAMKVMSLLFALLVIVAMAPGGEAQISCGTVISSLNPCIPYVTKGAPLGGCCGGVQGLFAAVKTTADRQSVCKCLKGLAQAYSQYISRAASLPRLCGVSIPYNISPSTNCATVR